MKNKKMFNYIIFKVNSDILLLASKHKLCIIIYIIKNDQKQFLIRKKILYIQK